MKLRRLSWVAWTMCALGCVSPAQQLNRKGVEYYTDNDIWTAKEFFLQSLNDDPEAPDILYNLASCYHRLRQYKEADFYYRRCLTNDPMFAKGYRGLAALLIEQDQEDKAFGLLEQWAAKHPDVAMPRIELAWLHRHAGDLQRARQLLDEAQQIDPNNTVVLTELADINYALGLRPEARALYQQSLALNPDQPEARARLSSLDRATAGTAPRPRAAAERIAAQPKRSSLH